MSKPATIAKPSPRKRAIKAALLILLLGPLIGAILLFVTISLYSAISGGDPLRDLAAVPYAVVVAVLTAPVAYLLGGPFAVIAAILTGVWVGRGNPVGYGAATALAVASCLIAVLGSQALALVGVMDGGLVLENLALVGPVAIGTALVLCWLTRRFGWN